jgi:hypothetical protein
MFLFQNILLSTIRRGGLCLTVLIFLSIYMSLKVWSEEDFKDTAKR